MSEAILVTGAGGFIGVPLVEALQAAGHLVHTHSRQASLCGGAIGCEPLRADFSDIPSLLPGYFRRKTRYDSP